MCAAARFVQSSHSAIGKNGCPATKIVEPLTVAGVGPKTGGAVVAVSPTVVVRLHSSVAWIQKL